MAGGFLLQKFAQRFGLDPLTRAHLDELVTLTRSLRPRADLVREGENPAETYFLLDGIACRYKLLPGGRRAVVGFLLAGDFCGPGPEMPARLDHGIAALTPCIVAEAPRHPLTAAAQDHPGVALALARATAVESAIQRQWLANMGCQSDRRLAHLLCEFRARMARVGLADERRFPLPLTQQDLSEAAGISTVHINRTLQHLKELGLIRSLDRSIVIPSLDALEHFADFDPAYLETEVAMLARLPGYVGVTASA